MKLPAGTDLSQWTVEVTGDVDALLSGTAHAFTLCEATDGMTGLPVFRPAANELPVGWMYDISPTIVSLRYPKGLRVIFH